MAARKPKVPRASLTGRAIALAVVILILVISYASSLRVYFAQAHEIAETKVEIAQRQQAIEELQSERSRWDNPDYVRAQARERLGWVVPGEIGYRVVDANGKPLGGGEEIDPGSSGVAPPSKSAWWTKLQESVKAADQPAPATKEQPAADRSPWRPEAAAAGPLMARSAHVRSDLPGAGLAQRRRSEATVTTAIGIIRPQANPL